MSHRKYANPDQRNIRLNKEVFEFVSDCGLEHNFVYLIGAELIWLSYGKTGLLPQRFVEKYSDIFNNSNQSIFSPESIQKLVSKFSEHIKTIQAELAPVKSLNEFFNENIRNVLEKERFNGYVSLIFHYQYDALEQRSVINELLEVAGVYNGKKTYAGSHDTNDVYNWLVELKRGGL